MVEDFEAEKIIERVINSKWVKRSEEIDVEDGCGRVLVEDLYSPTNKLACDAALYSGYALRSIDGMSDRLTSKRLLMPIWSVTNRRNDFDSVTFSVVPETPLKPFECVAAIVSAPLPPGADSVVPYDEVEEISIPTDSEQITVKLCTSPVAGRGIRKGDRDLESGALLAAKGRKLGSADVARFVSAGVKKLSVHEKPVVALLSIGKVKMIEVEDERPLERGETYNSTRTIMLKYVMSRHAIEMIDAGIAADEPIALKENLTETLKVADVVCGVSGDVTRYLRSVLETDFDASIHFSGIFMHPSNAAMFATFEWEGSTKVVFALPGDPQLPFVTTILCVLPAVLQMEGVAEYRPKTTEVKVNKIELKEVPLYVFVPMYLANEELSKNKEQLEGKSLEQVQELVKDNSKLGSIVMMRFPSKTEDPKALADDSLTCGIEFQDSFWNTRLDPTLDSKSSISIFT